MSMQVWLRTCYCGVSSSIKSGSGGGGSNINSFATVTKYRKIERTIGIVEFGSSVTYFCFSNYKIKATPWRPHKKKKKKKRKKEKKVNAH